MNMAKDLSKEPPRSPRIRLHGYAIAARMIDKGRAHFRGNVGDYHFDCPVDRELFNFKGVTAEQITPLLQADVSDEAIIDWIDKHGTPRAAGEVTAWSDTAEAMLPYNSAEHADWFAGVCSKLGLNPATTTLFDYLEADDRATFGK
jgi:hypothetical protein